jgi:superfamily II DNA or RNA helicase
MDLRPVYDSSEFDLVADLIVPLLSNAVAYHRGVGFFTSGWLRLAAEGLAKLVANDGRAKLIMSPVIEKQDWDAIQLGEKAKADDLIKQLLHRRVEDIRSSLETDTLNTFAWLLADGLVEIRFAIPRHSGDMGMYHDKVACFVDREGDAVAIHGSFNDSVQGSLNGEAFSVFRSWDPGQQPFVVQHQNRLAQLWDDRNAQFRAITMPEAVRSQIVSLRSTTTRPYVLPAHSSVVTPPAGGLRTPVSLYDYQTDALDAWKCSGRRGIFEMATGTGKTFTALAAAVDAAKELHCLACVILVPYLHLVSQWEEHCKRFGFSPVLCSGSHPGWAARLQSAIVDFKSGIGHLCVLAVHNTAAGDDFRRILRKLDPKTCLLVADEAHALGARHMRAALHDVAGMRLGLTATPRRWYDEEGTAALLEYFASVCYEFTLDQAIARQFLVPYDYHPLPVTLSEEEEQTVAVLTRRISMLSQRSERNRLEQDDLDRLLRDRARVLARAEGKDARILSAIRAYADQQQRAGHPVRDILVYCAPGNHKNVLKQVAELGLTCHEFVHDVSPRKRTELLQEFAAGRLQALIAIKCLDEGVDIPSTRQAFFMASTTNPREFIQRRGRVLRKADGKESAGIWDCAVVPSVRAAPDLAAYLLRREMPRVAEFTDAAKNKYDARSILRPTLDQHQMLQLFDMKPWDVYREAHRVDGESDAIEQPSQ